MASADTDNQLAWEARVGGFAAAAAGLSVVLFVGSSVLGRGVGRQPPRALSDLAPIARQPAEFLAPAVAGGLAVALVGVALFFLYRATSHRRPDLPRAAVWLLAFGVVVGGITLIGQRVDIISVARELTALGAGGGERLEDVLRKRTVLQVILGLNLGAFLALGLSMILICVSAIRAGLLSRLHGFLGAAGAVSLVLPLRVLQVVLLLWLASLVALFLDRWPGGRGSAWETGEAMPWPTMAERNAEIERRRSALDGGDERDGAATAGAGPRAGGEDRGAGADSDDVSAAGDGAWPAPSRSKRKRGRRR
ncbi:MAG: hypothetical protein ABR521_06350 [Gaiellaceae bacterium]